MNGTLAGGTVQAPGQTEGFIDRAMPVLSEDVQGWKAIFDELRA